MTSVAKLRKSFEDNDIFIRKYAYRAWKDDRSPEEMAADIRNSRHTGTRKIMPLD